jgi:hypothetical protein
VYGRWEDIETFFVISVNNHCVSLHFPGVYSGTQDFGAPAPQHQTATIPAVNIQIDKTTGRPIVWTNTWNNMFGEQNTNPGMDFVAIKE